MMCVKIIGILVYISKTVSQMAKYLEKDKYKIDKVYLNNYHEILWSIEFWELEGDIQGYIITNCWDTNELSWLGDERFSSCQLQGIHIHICTYIRKNWCKKIRCIIIYVRKTINKNNDSSFFSTSYAFHYH